MAGYEVISVDNQFIAKEITLLAGIAVNAETDPPPWTERCDGAQVALRHLGWLHRVADTSRDEKRPVGIFGSSISGTWLATQIGETAQFFVDEDPNRIGKQHIGRPILSIEAAPPDVRILMPMHRDIATMIAKRLSNTHRGLVIPPPFPEIDRIKAQI
jgi:hypothetical protein